MKMTPSTCRWSVALLMLAALTACGGGGSDEPAPSTDVFPLEAAYKAAVASGSTTDYLVSGSCTGNARLSYSAPARVSWDGATVLAVSQNAVINYSNCTPASNTTTALAYYDLDYNPLATATSDGTTGRFEASATGLPSSVRVGDSGTFGTEMLYSDVSQTVVVGRTDISYRIDADTASTVLATMIAKIYSADDRLQSTQSTSYRLTLEGGFTPMQIEFQYAAGSSTQLLFTRQ